MFDKYVKTKKNITIKNNTKTALKKDKFIENTISLGDSFTKFFGAQDFVLDADIKKKQNKLPGLNLAAFILNYVA